MPSNRFPVHNLDFLRAVAVLCVVVSHLRTMFGSDWLFGLNMPVLGFSGVLIFFVHTSLVLLMSLQRMPPQHLTWAFYTRRAFRIYPLSMVCVLLYVAFRIPYNPQLSYVEPSGTKLALNLLLLQNINKEPSIIGPLWSLPYEIQMYLALPFLFMVATAHRGTLKLAGIYVCFLAAAVGEVLLFGHANISRYGPCFFGGVCSYQLGQKAAHKWPALSWPLCLMLCLLFMQVTLTPFLGQARPTMLMAWAACLLVGIAIPHFRDSTAQGLNTVCKTIAKYSYGIYLTHEVALWIAFNRCSSWPLASKWAIFTFLAVALATASYHLIESPMIEFGRRLGNRTFSIPSTRIADQSAS